MNYNTKYENALKHVKGLKEFNHHLFIYIVFNAILLLSKGKIMQFILTKTENLDEGFLLWLNINIWFIPIAWGIGLLIHGFCVYKISFFKDWENKKIKESKRTLHRIFNFKRFKIQRFSQ